MRLGRKWLAVLIATAVVGALSPSQASAGAIVTGINCPSFAVNNFGIARNLFMGRTKARSAFGNVEIVFQESSSLARVEFEERVIGESGADFQADLSRLIFSGEADPPLVVSDDAAVRIEVNSKRCAIGYVSDAALNESLRILLRY